MSNRSWIAVDWGTSNLRAWHVSATGAILDQAQSDQGMATLEQAGFETALLALITDWLPKDQVTSVIACGMVGARQGWIEAPYVAAPCPPPGMAQSVVAPVRDPRISLQILPGVMQNAPPDVMRGEETQIAGFLATEPQFDGVLCMPGTHTKWVRISAGEIVSFQTFMSGEMFAILSQHSVLKHSVGTGWDRDAFAQAVSDGIARPQALAARLFALRAAGLLSGMSPDTARASLSGYLIGLELAGSRPYWLGQDVVVVGKTGLADNYAQALIDQGATARMIDADGITLAGLGRAHAADQQEADI